MEFKKCSDCGETKAIDEFYTQKKTSANGVDYIYYPPKCKKCSIKIAKKNMYDNYEKHKENVVKHESQEFAKAKKRERTKKSREKGTQREWRQNNRDKLKQYSEYRKTDKKHEISKKEWLICKEYFNNSCAYCGLHQDNHHRLWSGKLKMIDLHKEHVINEGSNKLDNCIPSCHSCNSYKWEFTLEEWYNENNSKYSSDRFNKIHKWLNEDYKEHIAL